MTTTHKFPPQETLKRTKFDQQLGELEKEKMMRELEVKELISQHRAEIRNIEMQMSALKVSGVLLLVSTHHFEAKQMPMPCASCLISLKAI